MSGAVGTRTPELIIGRMLSITAVQAHGRAVGLAGQLRMLVSGAISGVFYPAFARIRDAGEPLAPPYLRVVAGMSATTWPAMAFLAAASTPIVLMLYGERWAAVAPLLVWIALSEIPFTALPLHMDLPILLGRMRRLIQLNLMDTAASLVLLVVACLWSVEWAAASRVGYGLVWLAIYAGFMRRLADFRWCDMLRVYGQSLVATAATVAPLLLIYWRWAAPEEIDFVLLAGSAALGCLGWLAAIYLVRHPIRHEVTAVLGQARAALMPRLRAG
jgi:O-antigen/teichoic acid export membrane protein